VNDQGFAALARKTAGYPVEMQETTSINEIRTAIRELSLRADLAHKEGRHDDAAEIERRIGNFRRELGERP
jgi:hypothetical protein